MKLLNADRDDGYARIEIENEDDLWYLKDVISPGDRVKAVTQRTKLDGREKKTLKLELEAEKVDYQEDRLRVTGEMLKGDEDVEHGYHTFNLEPGKEVELEKEGFSDGEWSTLEEAESHHSYEVLFCLVDKGEADLYMVKESGIEDVSTMEENIPGKLYADQKTGEGFLEQVKSVLERSDAENVVVAGPGFQKQKLYDMLPEETRQKTFVQDTSVTGETGLQEAIKRGALDQVVESSRVSEETEAVSEFLEALEADSRKVDYGEPVKDLAEQGAVEKLLLTDGKFREEPGLVEDVEQQGGTVEVVHTDHEAGERLEKLGGIAAFLRYDPR